GEGAREARVRAGGLEPRAPLGRGHERGGQGYRKGDREGRHQGGPLERGFSSRGARGFSRRGHAGHRAGSRVDGGASARRAEGREPGRVESQYQMNKAMLRPMNAGTPWTTASLRQLE